MKRSLVIIVVIIGLLLGSAYVFFPRLLNVSNIESINCNINTANRFLIAGDRWPTWWPGNIEHDNSTGKLVFLYNGYRYDITGYKYNAVDIRMQAKEFTTVGTIYLVPVGNDSLLAEWKYPLETNSNPINRIRLYLEAKKINNDVTAVMKRMKDFLEKNENVYGMRIDQVLVKDTILVTTKISSDKYPSTSELYNLIGGIKNYISINKAKETNFPMVHVWSDSGRFHTTVAIPVDRKIPENNIYSIKRMVPGKILVSQVTGGDYTAREALRQLGLFISDHNLSSPAIPFESLVTDRTKEPDTLKWITKIYYPVF